MSGEKDQFLVDPALNVPYGGGPSTKLSRMRLRLLKEELKHNPDVSYVKDAVREFIPGIQSELNKMPKGSNLIVMPSTTGTNTVPADVAIYLKEQRPDLHLLNLNHDLINTQHDTESKVKRNYAGLATDPRQFEFNEAKITRLAQKDRPTYIIDDSISSGETAFVLQRQLSKRGVHAKGIVAAISGEKRHTYPSDMARLYDKITQDYPKDYSPQQLQEDIYTQFAGFPRKKSTDFERVITSGDELSRDNALRYLKVSSEYYRQQQLDPARVLERLSGKQPQDKKLGLYDQLKVDYPNLNEEEVSRYAKIMQQRAQRGITGGTGKDLGLEHD